MSLVNDFECELRAILENLNSDENREELKDKNIIPDTQNTQQNSGQTFESYILDKDYRDIIDSKRFAELNVHPSGQAFKNIPQEFREQIPLYVKENVDMERLVSA